MQVVAVKQLDRNGLQGKREFVVLVLMLGRLHHPNLVDLIGYCADGNQRLLVYEFMPLGSLQNHLHGKAYLWYFNDHDNALGILTGGCKGLTLLFMNMCLVGFNSFVPWSVNLVDEITWWIVGRVAFRWFLLVTWRCFMI